MPPTTKDAYRALDRAGKGHARGAPAYSVYVNRRLGRVFAALASPRGVTPNQATAISAAHTTAALVLLVLAPVAWWTGLAVAALFLLGYAWDSADGQLARLTGAGSLAGEWLDHFVDAAKIGALHLVVVIALWRNADLGSVTVLAIPLAFSVVSVVTFFGMLLNDLIKQRAGVSSTHERGGGSAARSLMLLPTDFGALCLVFVLWGWTTGFLVAYTILAALCTAFLGAAAVKWFREISALDSGS